MLDLVKFRAFRLSKLLTIVFISIVKEHHNGCCFYWHSEVSFNRSTLMESPRKVNCGDLFPIFMLIFINWVVEKEHKGWWKIEHGSILIFSFNHLPKHSLTTQTTAADDFQPRRRIVSAGTFRCWPLVLRRGKSFPL